MRFEGVRESIGDETRAAAIEAPPLGACLSNDRRNEGDPQRADFCDRFPRIAGFYVRERIAESRRCGSAAVGEHYSDRLLLSASHSEALSELLPLLLCGEESAVLTFAHHAHAPQWGDSAREEFTRMEQDETCHARWLRHLQDCLPAPKVEPRLRRQVRQFFSSLAGADVGIHLGQVATLDSAVCLILGGLRDTGVCKPGSPVARVFAGIHCDEARHVAITRRYARELCSRDDLLACAGATREGLTGILSARARALDTLGICPDRLFGQLRRPPRGLFP
jgi:hypothetical protein